MRKPGWYWVKFGNGNDWECKRLVPSGYWASHDGVMETEPSEVGPRIPTPDEPWQCVPVEATPDMLDVQTLGYHTPASKRWRETLAAAPKPESQP